MHRLTRGAQGYVRVGGRNRFVVGARWSGTMHTNNGAVRVELHITNAKRYGFEGDRSSGRFGRPAGQGQRRMPRSRDRNADGRDDHRREDGAEVQWGSFRDRLVAEVVTMDQGAKDEAGRLAKLELNLSESLSSSSGF